ncbi:MAG: lipoprotein-releasing ABC transporter permease subunit [Nitrospirae bacterium]|nr:lipoprotein-releasing ABC transporter permease subunit [Nitrospirota bacterium]
MNVPLFVARRYLLAKRKQVFISVTTGISVLGVALGVMALVVVLSVMGGFEEEVRSKILGTNAHLVVLRRGGGGMEPSADLRRQMESAPGVAAVSPFIFSQAMVRSLGNLTGVVIKGIEPGGHANVTDLLRNMVEGSLDALDRAVPGEPAPIVVGRELSRNLAVFMGDTLDVISPLGEVTPVGMVPRFRTFRVAGIFQTGMYEYDSSFVYIALPEAQEFFNMSGRITGYEVKVHDIYGAHRVGSTLEEGLGADYFTRHWMEMNQNLFAALKLEKTVMFLILLIIIVVASFGIVATLVMMVMEKGRDVAILRAMGATARMVSRIFVWQGLLIGVTGTGLGLAGGYALCLLLKQFQFVHLPADVYYITTLPVNMQPLVFGIVGVSALVICLAATLYPARAARRLDPVEALRYE